MLNTLERRLKARLKIEQLEPRNMLSVSTNVVVNNTAEDPSGTGANFTQSETFTVVANDGSIVTGFNDSEENLVAGGHFSGFSRSANGGGSFTDGDALPNTAAGDAGDPALGVNKSNGNIYYAALSGGINGPTNRIQIFRSQNNGQSFTFLSNAGAGFTASAFLDKVWLAVDNASGTGQGNIYVTTTDFAFGAVDSGIFMERSSNGGTKWAKNKVTTLGNSVQGSNVEVGADHSVYVAWWDANTSPERIMIRKSTNRGQTFGAITTVANLKTTGGNGDLGLDFRTNAFPMMATNPANSSNLYIVYNDVGQNAGDRGDIYFTQSNNGGSTWTTPVVLNSDSAGGGTADQWQPSITVTPDGTHLYVGWYDRRLSGPGNGNINRFGVIGTISGSTVTFGSNFQVDDTLATTGVQGWAENFGHDAVVNSSYMGDYDQAAASADNTKFYDSWGDNRLASAPDVFLASIDTNTGTGVRSLVVHGTDFHKLGDGPAGDATAVTGGSQSQAFLGGFVSPAVIKSGGGSAAAVTTKKGSNIDQVFAANVLIGSGQFQGNHHANKVSDDSLWHFGDL